MGKMTGKSKTHIKGLYTFDVFIVNGPMTERFAKKNKVISRTIQIRGNQTLDDLHEAIFDAFNREDEHLYEFQIGGSGPMDQGARRYDHPEALGDLFSDESAGDASRAKIDTLGLKVGDIFGYWFDFGDDWWHRINVISIEDKVPPGEFPRIIKRVGESPPQYGG